MAGSALSAPSPLVIHLQISTLKNVAGTALFQLIGMGMTLLVGVQLARLLGPGQYGIYGAIVGIVAVAAVFAQAALPQLLIRDLAPLDAASDRAQILAVLGKSARVFIVSCGLTLVVGVLAGFAVKDVFPVAGTQTGTWAILLVVSLAALNIISGVLRGLHQIARAQLVAACLRPSVFAGLLAFAWFIGMRMSTGTALSIQLAALLVVIAMGLYFVQAQLPRAPASQGLTQPLPTWRLDMMPMMLTELVRTLDAQMAILLLAALMADTDVGHYRVAMSSAVIFAFPYTVATLLLMPAFAKDHAVNDLAKLEARARTACAWCIAVTVLTVMFIAAFGEHLISLIFGGEYRLAAVPLLILGLAYLIQAIFGFGAAMLNMCNKSAVVTKAYVLGLVLSVALAFPLVNALGISGMAWAITAGYTGRSLVLWLAVRSGFNLNIGLVGLASAPARKSHDV